MVDVRTGTLRTVESGGAVGGAEAGETKRCGWISTVACDLRCVSDVGEKGDVTKIQTTRHGDSRRVKALGVRSSALDSIWVRPFHPD